MSGVTFHYQEHYCQEVDLNTLIRYTLIIWVIKVPAENDMVYLIHTLRLMILAMMVAIKMAS